MQEIITHVSLSLILALQNENAVACGDSSKAQIYIGRESEFDSAYKKEPGLLRPTFSFQVPTELP